MKIIITFLDSMVARNFFYTGILDKLTTRGFSFVVIPPPHMLAESIHAFEHSPAITVYRKPFWGGNTLDAIFTRLCYISIPTRAMRIKILNWYFPKKPLHYMFFLSVWLLAHFKFWQRVLRFLQSLLPVSASVTQLLEEVKPDMVIATTMLDSREVDLLRLAKKQKKVAVGMFKSWDNPTSKANVRFFPDYIICLTNYIAQEAHLLYGYPLNRCFVSGVPQYDMYSNPGILWERETFCNKLGLDPHKKIILYAPSGDWMTPDDIDILREVLQWVNTGKFGDTQVLLRLHPAYYSSTEKLSGRPNLIVHRPGHHSTDVLRNFIFDKDDIQLLANTLHHSQVLINSGSTLNIEAAIFDKPSINVCYDVRRNLPFRDSVVRFYQREHLVNIINTGALNMVHSHTELFNAIVQAFKNPAEKSLERRQLSLSQGYDPEGKAAENIAEFIYKLGSK